MRTTVVRSRSLLPRAGTPRCASAPHYGAGRPPVQRAAAVRARATLSAVVAHRGSVALRARAARVSR
jgi:hypothetical protein